MLVALLVGDQLLMFWAVCDSIYECLLLWDITTIAMMLLVDNYNYQYR
jgi:hypothetical protein